MLNVATPNNEPQFDSDMYSFFPHNGLGKGYSSNKGSLIRSYISDFPEGGGGCDMDLHFHLNPSFDYYLTMSWYGLD